MTLCKRIPVGLSLLVVAVVLTAATSGAAVSTTQPAAVAAAARDAVGALFTLTPSGRLGNHFCTGTVVDSPKGDVVLTAAHCLSGQNPGSFAFVPGYQH